MALFSVATVPLEAIKRFLLKNGGRLSGKVANFSMML